MLAHSWYNGRGRTWSVLFPIHHVVATDMQKQLPSTQELSPPGAGTHPQQMLKLSQNAVRAEGLTQPASSQPSQNKSWSLRWSLWDSGGQRGWGQEPLCTQGIKWAWPGGTQPTHSTHARHLDSDLMSTSRSQALLTQTLFSLPTAGLSGAEAECSEQPEKHVAKGLSGQTP